jgi:Transposase.
MREYKCEAQTSAGKVMATIFWVNEGILLMEFLKKGTTINSGTYVQTLQKL